MSETKQVSNLLAIKVAASRCSTKLEAILNIKSGWDTDDEGLAEQATSIGVLCENAVVECQEVIELVDDMLGPPPYEDRRHRVLEIKVLCERAHDYLAKARTEIASLREQSNHRIEMRLVEASVRARDASDEAEDMKTVMSGLATTENGVSDTALVK